MTRADVSKRDIKYLNLALKLANRCVDTHRHGCVVVSGGRPISMAYNRYANNSHAETNALKGVDARGTTVYVARKRRCQPHGLSMPCENCHAALKAAGVRRVVLHDQRRYVSC